MKKYLAELVGTFVLTFLGCGAAVSLSCGVDTASVVGTAVAFGLAVVAMAYTIGGISGCHINPAITLGVFLSGKMSFKDCGLYMVFQIIGALLAAAVLCALAGCDSGLGANALQEGISMQQGIIAEVVLTMLFVLVVLGATSKTNGATGNFAGLAIGLSLIREPRPLHRPGPARRRTSAHRPVDFHRGTARGWSFGCPHLEVHRLREVREGGLIALYSAQFI